MMLWYPLVGHPFGASDSAWYVEHEPFMFHTEDHPYFAELPDDALFHVTGDQVFMVAEAFTTAPELWFVKHGTLIHRTASHVCGPSTVPVYEVR
jgi:hypothetical protein